jgi:hypothetical protein
MTNAKLVKFVKLWREIKSDQASVDYRRSVWARDARAEFSNDDQFIKWMGTEFNESEFAARELLTQAAVVRLVPDAQTHARLGGSKGIKPVLALPTKREQIDAIEAAKAGSYAVSTIVNQRRAVAEGRAAASGRVVAVARQPVNDAVRLAAFILARVDQSQIPNDLYEVIRLYVVEERRAKAA